MRQVIEGQLTQAQAACWLGLSVCQIKRLCKGVREQDCAGVISRKRGKPNNRSIPQGERDRFISLVKGQYADFGPTLAAQYLRREHGFTYSAETLRSWMAGAGLWKPRRAKPQRIHSRGCGARERVNWCRSMAACMRGSSSARPNVA